MTELHSLDEANDLLMRYVPAVRELIGKDITLERTQLLMEQLGNPERQLKAIHIAGTSGKTSTSYYMASLLKAAGKTTGLTVSPHIDSVTERVQINLQPLSDQAFCEALASFIDLIKDVQPEPTYFELLTALAYWYFAKEKVDYAVIETGLGGLHDASNVAQREDKVCVITDIGYDHMHVLGSTLPEISRQKAGIIQEKNQVFTYQQSSEVMSVFNAQAKQKHATLTAINEIEEHSRLASSLAAIPAYSALPLFQQHNWLLAHRAYEYLSQRDGLPKLNDEQLAQSMHVLVPARMEAVGFGNKTLIMDGAHNEQKMQAFAGSFAQAYPGQKAAILLSMKQGKDFEKALPALLPITSRLVVTTFNTTQDLPAQAMDPEVLAEKARTIGFADVVVEPDQRKALDLLRTAPESLAVITGSFYLIAQLRATGIQ